jgi:hypothetical protein
MASHRQIEIVAYRMWLERGCPEGSPDVDWQEAVQLLSAAPFTSPARPARAERPGLRVVNAGSRWNRDVADSVRRAAAPQTA